MDAYHILERIGEGSFGKVYRGRRKYSGHIVALKFVTKRGKNAKDLENLREEIRILRRLNHCNIIAMLDSFETEGEFCMVTEYAQGELFQILEDDRQLPEDEIRRIAIQLTQALHVLHSNRIIHRDMKPQNILIGSKQQIKLCDFGFARAISHDTSLLTSIKGTPLYMAPELVRQQPYNYTVDLWSLGVILYELAVGRPPFYTDRIVSLIEMIVREPVKYPPTMSTEFQGFLAGLLNKDPSRRMTWPEILTHPFVLETVEQQQARVLLESQVRALPRFFKEDSHVSMAEVKPSVERLRTSGEWKICDPETGRQIEIHDVSGSGPEAAVVQTQAKVPEKRMAGTTLDQKQTEKDAGRRVQAQQTAIQRFVDEWHQFESKMESSSVSGHGVLEDDLFLRALGTLASSQARGVGDAESVLTAVAALMQVQYRALVACLKTIDNCGDSPEIKSVIATQVLTHKFLHALVAECDNASAATAEGEISQALSDVIYQVVRCCMLFTTIVNTSDGSKASEANDEQLNYRELCKSDVKSVNALLRLKGPLLYSAHSKTLKWLGSMLDRSKNLTMFLEQVHPSGVIETLCEILRSSGASRSPGGRISKGGRDLGMYAAFALSTFVQPDGSNWGPLQPFPIVTLMAEDISSQQPHDQASLKDLKHLFKLRVKVHAEVVAQLLKNGLVELLALLCDELSARANKKTNNNNSDGEEGEEEDDDDQSSVCCILKVLVHACRSSVPLSKKLPQTLISERQGQKTSDIVSILRGGIAAKVLRSVELYFAVELLAVILHRSVLSKVQVWLCAKTLFPLFCESNDVALLSALSNFYSDAIEGGGIDESVLETRAFAESDADEEDEEELWHFLARGFLPERCADAVFRLLDHQQIASLSVSNRNMKLQMLSCYNIRAQGLIDAGVVLLLRVASKAGKQPPAAAATAVDPKSVEMKSFVAAFQQAHVWEIVSTLLATGGSDLLSPWGLFCFLKLMRIVREIQCHDPPMEAAINEHLIPHLVNLLELKHIVHLFHWPDTVGGGSNAVKALVHAIVKVLGIPFMHGVSEELLVGAQEVLYDVECVQKLLGVLRFVFSTKEFHLEASVLELPMSFLSRLVTSSEHFGVQLVRADGMLIIKECEMLQSTCSPSLIIDTILIVSQLARSSQENYESILHANLLPEFRQLIQYPEPMVRAKSLNCIGNLCRHSTLFYEPFATPIAGSSSLLDGVIQRLGDPDSYVRRFACFAIGNAAFHNNSLYSALQPAIPLLIQNLHDPEEKTRSNAGGALGNLVRNSDELCAELCHYQAPLKLFELAMTDASLASRRIVLFSLGNFCVYPLCYESILEAEPEFTNHLEHLYEEVESDEVSKKNIRRVLSKIDALSSGDTANGGYTT
ncbi:Ulk/fused protein kinase [Globisporangium polare]